MPADQLVSVLTQLVEKLTALTQAVQGSNLITGGGGGAGPALAAPGTSIAPTPSAVGSNGAGPNAAAVQGAHGGGPAARAQGAASTSGSVATGIGLAHLPIPAGTASQLADAVERARRDAGRGGHIAASVIKSFGAPSAAVTQREIGEMQALAKSRTPQMAAAAKKYDADAADKFLDRQFGALLKRLPPAQAAKAKKAMAQATSSASSAASSAKKQVGRARPFQQAPGQIKAIVKEPKSKSFPSGHASGSYARAEVLALLDPANASKYRAVAAQAAVARNYVGVHFPSDVAAGAYVGTLAATRAVAAAGLGKAASKPAIAA